jgi:hypothetical protein
MCIPFECYLSSMPLIEGETTCNERIIDPDEKLISWAKMTCTKANNAYVQMTCQLS